MLARIRDQLSPPQFEGDGEKTRVAALVHTVLLIVFGLVAVYGGIILLTGGGVVNLVLEGVLLLVAVGLLVVVRRGWVRPAAWVLTFLLWGLISLGTYVYGGLSGSGMGSFFGVVLIAGLLLGKWASLFFALLSLISAFGMLLAELVGVAPTAPDFVTPVYRWLEFSITIVGIAGLFYLVMRSLEDALDRARRNELEAVEVSQFKSRLIARVSHELRTPLAAVVGYADMLKCSVYGPLAPKQQQVMDRILLSSNQLDKLIAEMLDQTRFESGDLRLNMRTFSPPDVVDRVIAELGTLARNKGLSLDSRFEGHPSDTVYGDPERVQQVLYHLVDNAIKFTHEGGVEILVSQSDNAHWRMQVVDTGIGISDQALSYIFDPFRQVDESVTREYGGVGLGLSIVRHLVTLMQGKITVESELGQGSTFTVMFPIEIIEEKTVCQSL